MQGRRWVMRSAGEPLVAEGFAPRAPNDGEALLAVAGCGVCHTDVGFLYEGVRTNQAPPLVLGHEIAGRVIDAGEGARALIGAAVIVPAVLPCGTCDLCLRGRATICRAQRMPGNDFDGGFATHVTVPARDLCVVDEDALARGGLELWQLAVVADAVSTAYQAVEQAGVTSGDLVIVVGAGGVGGYCAQIARARGAVVACIDVDDEKLAAIASIDAAAATWNARSTSDKELRQRAAELAQRSGARRWEHKVFECSGTRRGQETAFSLLTYGSTLAVVGFTLDKVELRLSTLMALHARALGNWGCAPDLYPAALRMVLGRAIAIGPFVERHPLDDVNTVLKQRHERRAVLIPTQETSR